MSSSKARNAREPAIAAGILLLCMLPLFLAFLRFGYSSGHDLPFHIQSWQDAAWQLQHGVYPQWDITAARGVGEPRFVFYPPISWLLGAVLSMVVPIPRTADVFIVVALLCCGLSMFFSVRRYVAAPAAVVAAVFFALNPYMLFNGLERSAFGELLASAWLPPLVIAALESRPRLSRIAIPYALLWLTNIPTAIIGSYLLGAIVCLRLIQFAVLRRDEYSQAERLRRYLFGCVSGALLGMLATAFFLFPAIHQMHYVQLSSAFVDGQNYRDSFLLHHTAHSSRQVIHSVSWITAELLGFFTGFSLVLGYITRRANSTQNQRRRVLLALIALAAIVTFLLLPPSVMVWHYAPELSVLQFPWRLLGVLAMLCSFVLAMFLDTFAQKRTVLLITAVMLGWFLAVAGQRQYWLYRGAPDHDGLTREQVMAATERRPTNEYTPTGADNTNLLEAGQAYWSGDEVPPSSDAAAFDLRIRARPVPSPPQHLQVDLPQPEKLVLNVRNYPSWSVVSRGQPLHVDPRQDGRITVGLPAGTSSLDVRWHRGTDEIFGVLVSLLAICAIGFVAKKERESKQGQS